MLAIVPNEIGAACLILSDFLFAVINWTIVQLDGYTSKLFQTTERFCRISKSTYSILWCVLWQFCICLEHTHTHILIIPLICTFDGDLFRTKLRFVLFIFSQIDTSVGLLLCTKCLLNYSIRKIRIGISIDFQFYGPFIFSAV